MFARALFALQLVGFMTMGTAGWAQNDVQTAQTRATLIADKTVVAPGDGVWVGLSLTIKPGWHTYWRTPGDSGLPTKIEWKLPAGVTAGAIQWPPPERLATAELMNFGYEGEVILLTRLDVSGAPRPLTVEADATWLVCADVCIPEDGHFVLPLTVAANAPAPSGEAAAAIAKVQSTIPTTAPWPVTIQRDGAALTVSAGPGLPAGITGAAFFPDGDSVIENAAPQKADVSGSSLTLKLKAATSTATTVGGVLVLEGPGATRNGFEVKADVPVATAAAESDMTLWLALVFAFLGGLVLNVMPCVLPVLVMKALAMVSRGNNTAALRRDAVIYTIGVMAAFTALIVALLAARAAGSAVGWGFQLQSPAVVAALAYVMLALGLSLSGVFTIGNSAAGIGQGLTTTGGGWGSFFTGVLAVVVAAPCTAPLMGVALGFALTQPPIAAIAVFEGLALGLAAPYLAIAFFPALARRLPRPGVWMERLKQVLAFPLYGAAAWLLWVLTQQVDAEGVALALAGLVCVGFAGWSWGLGVNHRAWAAAALVALVLVAFTVGTLSTRMGSAAIPAASASGAEPFTPARLAELRAEGRPVLVNFTAAWCITCLVNERVALSRPEVIAAIRDKKIAYLKADWTNRNAEITGALHALGRDGVPVYVVYPRTGAPKVLPQVLTPGLVVSELNAL